MTDITPTLNICLQQKGASTILHKEYDINQINSFLQEAYNINARLTELTQELRAIRPSYLSTAPPSRRQRQQQHNRQQQLTDRERDEIDASSKQLLRQLNHGINGFKQAELIRLETQNSVALSKRAKGGLGALGRWAAGGAVLAKSSEEEREEAERAAVAAHRESVIYYLQRRLELASRVQSEMMEVRLGREVEKSKSILHKSQLSAGAIPYAHDEDGSTSATGRMSVAEKRGSAGLANGVPADDDRSAGTVTAASAQTLSPEQMQIFAEENADLLKHYEDQLGQVRNAERSILEISELHNTLHANLEQQSEHIDQLVQDSYLTSENVGQGNKQLKRASERKRPAQAVFYATCAYCLVLIVWDLIF
ncbi:hypothetical protein K431DRAFT_286621 [Polychaeton citri CBS 116435]|uniref:t-SNARE coiled-coil homology domain-containing protein n=1 Tax=Polychaeton citri CBS 116435 TaxID=1314669 RepID=A0A9P4Q558_9PEZI|nr:hypothetical protein K431DRAFT_286621 [Polychaeton citri CBS 116435]